MFCGTFVLACAISACGQDPSTHFQEETAQLKKHTARLETINQALQEDNKVLRQQIDLLNQEVRKTADDYEAKIQQIQAEHAITLQEAQGQVNQLTNAPKEHAEKIRTLEQENQKLTGEAKWLRTQRDQLRKGLTIQQIGGQSQELPFSFSAVLNTVTQALTKNGYAILSSMETDQKAIYITEKKMTLPPSIELSGFRNQYILAIEKDTQDQTTIWVRAEFEKISQNGHIFSAPQAESAEIELRLIQDIHQTLTAGMGAQARRSGMD